MKQKELMIHIQDMRKVYRMGGEKVAALNRINLKIYKDGVCCIFGASGSGKSTLLNQLAGTEKPTRGRVLIQGVNISQMDEEELAASHQKHIDFIFQSYNLLPPMIAMENVALPLAFRGMEKEKREGIAQVLLRRVGSSHRLHHYPGQMLGGQQQRAGIARAFVIRPQVVFVDEPTRNLDSRTMKEIIKMIMGFARKYHETTTLVTHDPGMTRFADRIATLKDGNVIGDERMDGYAESI